MSYDALLNSGPDAAPRASPFAMNTRVDQLPLYQVNVYQRVHPREGKA